MAHPDGTRAWRKSHRRKWREGSTFRQVGSLAQRIVVWVEDNADDEGTVRTTTRYLSEVMSCYREPVNRMAVWRAIQSAIRVGLLAIPGVTAGVTPDVTASMTLTRVNFKQYQDRPEPAVTPAVTLDESQAGLSGRSKQKKQKEKTTPADAGERAPHPDWHALIEALNGAWTQKHKAKLVWHGKDWKPLRALLESQGADEIIRRWANYLGNDDKFYAGHPLGLFLSQVNRFVVGRVEQPSFREPWEGESPTGPGSPEWPAPSAEQIAKWDAEAKAELRRGNP